MGDSKGERPCANALTIREAWKRIGGHSSQIPRWCTGCDRFQRNGGCERADEMRNEKKKLKGKNWR